MEQVCCQKQKCDMAVTGEHADNDILIPKAKNIMLPFLKY